LFSASVLGSVPEERETGLYAFLKNFRSQIPESRQAMLALHSKWLKTIKLHNGTRIATTKVPVMYRQWAERQAASATPGARHEQPPTSGPQKGKAGREACNQSEEIIPLSHRAGGQ
jgi:hypothetical protein